MCEVNHGRLAANTWDANLGIGPQLSKAVKIQLPDEGCELAMFEVPVAAIAPMNE